MRAINRFGHEGPAELGKVEALLVQLDRHLAPKSPKSRPGPKQIRLKQTLAGALVSLGQGRIRIEPAPPRGSNKAAERGLTKRQITPSFVN
jgi:tRNA(Ile)-lysidine synthase